MQLLDVAGIGEAGLPDEVQRVARLRVDHVDGALVVEVVGPAGGQVDSQGGDLLHGKVQVVHAHRFREGLHLILVGLGEGVDVGVVLVGVLRIEIIGRVQVERAPIQDIVIGHPVRVFMVEMEAVAVVAEQRQQVLVVVLGDERHVVEDAAKALDEVVTLTCVSFLPLAAYLLFLGVQFFLDFAIKVVQNRR